MEDDEEIVDAKGRPLCARSGCDCVVKNNAPPAFNPDAPTRRSVHKADARENAPEWRKLVTEEPVRVRKNDTRLLFECIKPKALFDKENDVFAIGLTREHPVWEWNKSRRLFHGEVFFHHKDCAFACWDHNLRATVDASGDPLVSQAGWLLLQACENDDTEKAASFLQRCTPTDVNMKESQELRTPLHLAAINLNDELASQLIEKKAQVNATNKSEYTPLHYAAQREDEKTRPGCPMIQMLVGAKADMDAQTVQGRTALMWASMNGHFPTVRWLVEQGALRDIKDKTDAGGNFQMSAQAWANNKGHMRIRDFLKDVDIAVARNEWSPGKSWDERTT